MSKHNNLIIDAHNANPARDIAKTTAQACWRLQTFIRPALTNPLDINEFDMNIRSLQATAMRLSNSPILYETATSRRAVFSVVSGELTPSHRARKNEKLFVFEDWSDSPPAFRTYEEAAAWAIEVIRK